MESRPRAVICAGTIFPKSPAVGSREQGSPEITGPEIKSFFLCTWPRRVGGRPEPAGGTEKPAQEFMAQGAWDNGSSASQPTAS